MPSGPYPTAFDSPHPERPQASSEQRNAAQRPPSPAPSYHTLPPGTHTSLSTPQSQAPAAIPQSLLSAAHNTPDAILSKLTLTNHTIPLPKHHLTGAAGGVSRYISARTADGRERYRVGAVDGGIESIVWRDAGPTSSANLNSDSNREALACIKGGSQALSVFLSNGGRKWRKEALASVEYSSMQQTGNLKLPSLTVEGKDVGMQWEVTTLSDFPSTSSNVSLEDSIEDGRRRSAHVVLREPLSRLRGMGMDTHEQSRRQAGLSSLHLVDEDCNIYADYSHKVGLPDLYKDEEVWGEVRLRARSILIDGGGGALSEKMDQAFLTLVLLLEAYVRVLGGNKRADRNWGNFAGSAGCEVM